MGKGPRSIATSPTPEYEFITARDDPYTRKVKKKREREYPPQGEIVLLMITYPDVCGLCVCVMVLARITHTHTRLRPYGVLGVELDVESDRFSSLD